MDQPTQARCNILGSGNVGNNNTFGSYNTITNIYGLRDMANFPVGNQSGGFEAGDAASRPYRLIPYCRNSKFTGRKNLLESVKRLSESKGHNRVALHGLGGSGKTQIALEYVCQRAEESDRDIFWVHGSGILKFSEGFRAVAQRVRIPLASAETDEEDFLRGIRRWFEGPDSGDWILVVDSADNEDDFATNNSPIAKFIPQCAKGTLIFTTRSRQVASRQGCEMIEVGKMGKEEAEVLFSKRFGSWDNLGEEEKKVIRMILDSVHHLPLAIAGSAAFMTETATPPSMYWTIVQENEERMRKLLSEKFCDIQRETDVTESILSTYFVTFDRITKQMPLAANLLRLMAFFDRQNIPEALLSQCGLEGMDDSVEFRRAIGKLLGFSLITMVKDGNKIFYELHRLVQLSLQVYLPTEDWNEWRATALRVISRLFPEDPNELRYIGPAYIPHALAVTKDSTGPIAEELGFHIGLYFLTMGSYNSAETQFRRCIALREEGKEYDWDDGDHQRFAQLGWVKTCQGKYGEAETMYRYVLEWCENVLGPDHPHTLTSVGGLAFVLQKQGKYNESEEMNRHVLERLEKVLGPDHPATLTSLDNLAWVVRKQGKYDESETQHRRALEGRERVLGPDHPDTRVSVSNLAAVLQSQGKYDESEKMNRRSLAWCDKALGPDHPDTLTSVNNLVTVLHVQGKYDESEGMNRRVLERFEKVLGPDHPDTLTSVNNLAAVLMDQRKYDESETMVRRALEGHEKVLGPDHPTTQTSATNLAKVLQDQGKYEESEELNRRVLEIFKKVLGPNHPDTLRSVNNLAMVLQSQGKYDESEKMNRRALEGYERVLGLDHPDTLRSLDNLAFVMRKQGRYDESEAVNRRALEGREKILGPDHPDTLTSLDNLANVLLDQGKYNESEKMNRRVLERREKVLGLDHRDTLTSVSNLAIVLRNQGRYDESEKLNRRVREGFERIFGPDHPDTLTNVSSLAIVLRNQGRYDESEKLNRRILEGFEKVLGRDHERTIAIVSNLALVLKDRGKYEESEKMLRRALEGFVKVLGVDHRDTLTIVSHLALVLKDQGKYEESEKMLRHALEGFLKVLGPDHPDTLGSFNDLAAVLKDQGKPPPGLGLTGLQFIGVLVLALLSLVIARFREGDRPTR